MSASWNGKVALTEADAKPGHYYVTIKHPNGPVSFALGPFTQRKPGKEAHAQALGLVRKVRRYVHENIHTVHSPWYEYGTSRIDLCGTPPAGKLNGKFTAEIYLKQTTTEAA